MKYLQLLEERDAAELEASRRATDDAKLARAGIPELIRRVVKAGTRTQAFDAVDTWLAGPALWLLLLGSTGTGKSGAAGHAAHRSLRSGRSIAWHEAPGLARLAGGFGNEAAMAQLKRVDLLVVDEFGTEHQSGFADSVVFELLHRRHEDARRTVLTSNLDAQALGERLGRRLFDRIRSSCVLAVVEGPSLRSTT
ncbi:MAG: ATP-binding protein [Archangium sp.]